MKNHIGLRLAGLGLLLTSLFCNLPSVHAQEMEMPNLDLVIIIDESGSMWFQTDIPRERIHAFNLLMDTLASEGTTGDKIRVSVIAFGSAELSEIVFPFRPVNSDTVDEIKQIYKAYNDKLANPSSGKVVGLGWTDALHALNLAEQVLTDNRNGHLPGHKPGIIILSDGKPETAAIHEGVANFDQKITTYIDQMLAEAAQFQSPPGGLFYYDGPCTAPKEGVVPIYTIAVREGVKLAPIYREIWRKLAEQNGGDYKSKDSLTVDSLGSAYYDVWCTLTCCTSRLEPITVPMERLYPVHNTYKRIIFTVLKDNPDVQVEIYRPGVTMPLTGDDPHVILNQSLKDEVWSIARSAPWEGDWTVKLLGSGQVWFAYERYTDYFKVEQISPVGGFVKACTPLDIALRLVNSDGQPITQNVADFTLEVKTPEGQILTLGSIAPTEDMFETVYRDTCTEGEYQFSGLFKLTALPGSDAASEWPWQDTIHAVLDSYLSIVSPAPGHTIHSNEPLLLQADVNVGDKPDQYTATQKDVAQVHIYRDNRLAAGPYLLTYKGDVGVARLAGEVPKDTLPEGDYVAEFTLRAPGNPVPDVRQVAFTVLPKGADFVPPTSTPVPPIVTPIPTPVPPTPTSIPVPPVEPPPLGSIITILGAILGVLGLVGGWWGYRQLPAMPGLLLKHEGDSISIGQGWRGKFPQTKTFPTEHGESAKVQFYAGTSTEGERSTMVKLLNDLNESQMRVDDQWLLQAGDTATISSASERLVIDGEYYDISIF